MEIDHVFVFVEPDGPERAALAALGLTETYRRQHPGQGTENACYAFDNLYLELLWMTDRHEIRSPAIVRTGLFERAMWRQTGTCPFGLSWRQGDPAADLAAPLWDFRPPYLPEGMSIKVAEDGDDPRQPMMFRSPGTAAPVDWPVERQNGLQRPAGLGRVSGIELTMPSVIPVAPALAELAARTIITLKPADGASWAMRLVIERLDGTAPLSIRFPMNG